MQKIYILGSSGFIGGNLFEYLKNNINYETYSVGRNNSDVYVDLEVDYAKLVDCVSAGDMVVFLSSISSPEVCNNQSEFAYKVNVSATVGLIDELTQIGARVIFSSTDLVFGSKGTQAVDDSSLEPFGLYGGMKAEVEEKVLENRLVKVIRFSYVFGLGDKYSSLLTNMAENNKELDVFDGFERNVVVIDDVLEGICKLIDKWNEVDSGVINFSGPKLISRFEITKLFSEHVSHSLKYKLVEAPSKFWDSRPKTIEMKSNIFSTLLGREPMSIESKLQHWSE